MPLYESVLDVAGELHFQVHELCDECSVRGDESLCVISGEAALCASP